MAQWFKSLCMSPITYGLQHLNNVAINALTFFLNNYGNKLFRVGTEIIKETKCIEDMDVFYLYPIQIETHISQMVGCNLIMCKSGIIDDIDISFPWKTLLTTQTLVKIGSVDLVISIEPRSMTKSSDSIDIGELEQNQDLIIAYGEINDIIEQYFKSICIQVSAIHIKIDNLDINITDLTYSNQTLSINRIEIVDSMMILDMVYDFKTLYIPHLIIDLNIIKYLPEIYLTDELPTTNICINIAKLEIISSETIYISDIKFTIESGMITVSNFKELVITDIIQIYTHIINEYVCKYDQLSNEIVFNSSIEVCVMDWNGLTTIFDSLSVINLLSDKIIRKKSEIDTLIIKNGCMIISYLDKNFSIKADTVEYLSNQLTLTSVMVCDIDLDINLIVGSMICKYNSDLVVHLYNSCIQSPTFGLKSDYFAITKTLSELEFNFSNTHAIELMLFINYIQCMIALVQTDPMDRVSLTESTINVSGSDTLVIKLCISNSSFEIVHSEYNFSFLIKSGCIYIVDKIGVKIDLDIFMNERLISEVSIDMIDSTKVNISSCKIFLDPDIFDQLNYLLGTIPSDYVDGSNSQLILTQSIMTKSLDELEFVINNVSLLEDQTNLDNQPVIKLLLGSISDLHLAIINNYCTTDTNIYDFKIYIGSTNIYLFDELLKDVVLTDSFMCVVLTGIEFSKLSTRNKKTYSMEIKYSLKITNGYAIDMNSMDPAWKYFFKSTNDNYLLNMVTLTHDDLYKLRISIGSLVVCIREETLLRLLGFFSNRYQMPNPTSKATSFVENFDMSGIDIIVNFFPLILKENSIGSSMLFLKDFKIRLRQLHLKNISGFGPLLSTVTSSWNTDINPENILQFIPNIKIIQPYTLQFVQIMKLISKYFESGSNKKKLRAITKNINRGVGIVTYILRMGVDQVINLFN